MGCVSERARVGGTFHATFERLVDDEMRDEMVWECPIPIDRYPVVTLAHGDGGRLTHQLIEGMFLSAFGNDQLRRAHDGALLYVPGGCAAFTTDSYVVHPLFFPGGDIGSLAVHGTVNDLAMCGARPRYLSASFVLEEGLPLETLWRVVRSMAQAARESGVEIVTGDTKVVDRGKGDELYINSAGVGTFERRLDIHPGAVRADDVVLLSGDPGRHGLAVMAAREDLSFDGEIRSDAASVVDPVLAMVDAGLDIHCLRDITRGGLATGLVEVAEAGEVSMELREDAIPLAPVVSGGCELLGLDPLYLASEGRFVAVVPECEHVEALRILRTHRVSQDARVIGRVRAGPPGEVSLRTLLGTTRILERLAGMSLPRIC